MTEPKPSADDAARTRQIMMDAATQAVADMNRLDIATSIATGLLASQGYPWQARSGREARADGAAKFADHCYLIADALIESSKTQVISRETINRELVNAVASEMFSTTERAGDPC